MGRTLFEKIIARNIKNDGFQIGDIVEVFPDRVMIHDFFIPFVVDKFKEMGFNRVWDPDKVVIIYDHLVPATFVGDFRHHNIGEQFIAEHKIKRVHRTDGVCHQLMHEQGHVKPGDIVLGTDSHTVTYGAVGVLASGIGYTEMAAILGTGMTWLKVVPTIKINVEGVLAPGVASKDLILSIIGDIGSNGASYKAMEFCGSAIRNMSIDSRLTMSNMTVEAGAKAGLMEPDEKTFSYLGAAYAKEEKESLKSDKDAAYERVIEYDAADIVPSVACPHSVDNVRPVAEVKDVRITQAFLGSCTNGRLEDLAVAARILKGKKIHKNVRFIITPASRDVFAQAVRQGYIQTLVESGAMVTHPACGLCAGRSGGVLDDSDTIISSNNRNFLGRMGGNKTQIYLGSPATVAASAIEGKLTDPRQYLG